MRLLKIAFKREMAAPMIALVFGSAASVALIFGRILWTQKLSYGFLIWNLFLAWTPLILALLANHEYRAGSNRKWLVLGLGSGWLLFFPNAPYICTDVIHLTFWFRGHFWMDLTLILLFAFTGFMVGFLSLYLMQSLVAESFGRIAGWIFVLLTATLTSFGVYIGRFLRFNSWDVIVRPAKVYHGIDAWLGSPMLNRTSVGFLVFFAIFLFIAYVMLYALTHLSPAPQRAKTIVPETQAA